jgi:hypothetical protein
MGKHSSDALLFWEFIKAVAKRFLVLMSCAAFTFVGIFAEATNKSNSWIVGASFILASFMFILAIYQAWRDERIARVRLERESGPNILLKFPGEEGAMEETVEFINDGTETAIAVRFQEDPKEQIRLLARPAEIPYVLVNDRESIIVSAWRLIEGGSASQVWPIRRFVAESPDGMRLCVVFQNSAGVTFRRAFTIKQPIFTRKIHCFPEMRELVSEPIRTLE